MQQQLPDRAGADLAIDLSLSEHVCRDCGREFPVFLSLKEYEAKPKILCPCCDSDHGERKFSAFSARTSRRS